MVRRLAQLCYQSTYCIHRGVAATLAFGNDYVEQERQGRTRRVRKPL
ncbi:MAG: hypothetical protein V7K89_16305 [Nostoc sp.]